MSLSNGISESMILFFCMINFCGYWLIATIESSNLDKEQELKSKDERITHLENIMNEKSVTIASLRSDIESIQVSQFYESLNYSDSCKQAT